MGSRGNLNWNTKEVREIRRGLNFSDIQKSVLIGTILGDGCFTENFGKKHYRLQIEQGNNRKEYVFWFYGIFKNWILSPPKYLRERRSWRFKTISHPEITEFHEKFYRNRRKIIPPDIGKLLFHPISLAVWFMDDGAGRSDCRSYTFSTHSFSEQDNKLLVSVLEKNFGVKSVIHWDGKGYRIYIPAKESEKFENIILPYILPSMKYKFPLTP